AQLGHFGDSPDGTHRFQTALGRGGPACGALCPSGAKGPALGRTLLRRNRAGAEAVEEATRRFNSACGRPPEPLGLLSYAIRPDTTRGAARGLGWRPPHSPCARPVL